jgi:hypothetical protein
MSASLYHLLAWAIENRVPLDCVYDGRRREICPVILGQSRGHAVALVYQTGGETSRGPLRQPEWKCFQLSKLSGAVRAGRLWQVGASHTQAQSCVQIVDYDANERSPCSPLHSLGNLSGAPPR